MLGLGSKCDNTIRLPSCDPNGPMLMSRETAQVLHASMRELDAFNTKWRQARYSDQLVANIAMLGLKMAIEIVDIVTLGSLSGPVKASFPMVSGPSIASRRGVDMVAEAAVLTPRYDRDLYSLFPWSVVPYVPPPNPAYVDKCVLQYPLTGTEYVVVGGRLSVDISFYISPEEYASMQNNSSLSYYVTVKHVGTEFSFSVPLDSFFKPDLNLFHIVVTEDASKVFASTGMDLEVVVFHVPTSVSPTTMEHMAAVGAHTTWWTPGRSRKTTPTV